MSDSIGPKTQPTYHRVPSFLDRWNPTVFVRVGIVGSAISLLLVWLWWPFGLLVPFWVWYFWRGVRDINQTSHAVLRNFPVLGHMRYVLESLRPEIRQYFVESDSEQTPFARDARTVAYQRAKLALDTQPFGTRHNVYAVGHEWISHSLRPLHVDPAATRVRIGGPDCTRPYDASLFNISAMSYGSLSKSAVRALNMGARRGGFYHNTGEGGISPYHLEGGGDLCWQVGTGYFGCRAEDGGFSADKFKENAARDSVMLIEIKLSQGAKPSHGGILPAAKVTAEISAIRGVPMGRDVNSPPAHSAFDNPIGLMHFIAQLRELSGGKPIGFKLCVGSAVELLALVRAMLETGITPDFITVDGSEGGTGAAPPEFSNNVGMPMVEGLVLVHDALVGAGIRDRLKIISAGKITTGFGVCRQLALGADLCNSARGMMFALGCIQALKCNTNKCPVGVATQDERLMAGLVVPDKAERVYNFHRQTVIAVCELAGAAGLAHPTNFARWHLMRRTDATRVADFSQIYPLPPPGCLLDASAGGPWMHLWAQAALIMKAPVPASPAQDAVESQRM